MNVLREEFQLPRDYEEMFRYLKGAVRAVEGVVSVGEEPSYNGRKNLIVMVGDKELVVEVWPGYVDWKGTRYPETYQGIEEFLDAIRKEITRGSFS